MRVLLDENIPADLAQCLAPHETRTVPQMGWSGTTNGALLERASGHFDAFVTMDVGLSFQQNLADRPFGIVLVRAASNRMVDLRPLAPAIVDALNGVVPGKMARVSAE